MQSMLIYYIIELGVICTALAPLNIYIFDIIILLVSIRS